MKFLFFIFSLFLFTSCREDFAFKKEENLMDATARRWIFDTGKYTNLEFTDNNKSVFNLKLNNNKTDFTPTKSSFAGIPTKYSKNEQFTQFYESNGIRVGLIATAYNKEFGNIFSYSVNNTTFMLNIAKNEFLRIDDNNQYFSINDGKTSKLNSTFSFQKEYELKGINYPEVLIFELKDGILTDKSVIKTIYAPQIGLIYYKNNEGTENWRTNTTGL
jgi:hypothetical protein